jgi:ketosteroid isomerase-like protein
MSATATSLTDEQIFKATRDCIEAWNSLDLEATLATYTDDVVYRDPKTRGKIHGKDALRRYLTKFFAVWDMQFTVVEEHRLAGQDAQLCMWDCEIRHRAGGAPITVSGMDICGVRGTQLCRDEAFMDTLPLEALLDAQR